MGHGFGEAGSDFVVPSKTETVLDADTSSIGAIQGRQGTTPVWTAYNRENKKQVVRKYRLCYGERSKIASCAEIVISLGLQYSNHKDRRPNTKMMG